MVADARNIGPKDVDEIETKAAVTMERCSCTGKVLWNREP